MFEGGGGGVIGRRSGFEDRVLYVVRRRPTASDGSSGKSAALWPLGGAGDRVKVKLRIDLATGRVISADTDAGSGRSGVEPCIESAMLEMKFAQGGEGVQLHTRAVTL